MDVFSKDSQHSEDKKFNVQIPQKQRLAKHLFQPELAQHLSHNYMAACTSQVMKVPEKTRITGKPVPMKKRKPNVYWEGEVPPWLNVKEDDTFQPKQRCIKGNILDHPWPPQLYGTDKTNIKKSFLPRSVILGKQSGTVGKMAATNPTVVNEVKTPTKTNYMEEKTCEMSPGWQFNPPWLKRKHKQPSPESSGAAGENLEQKHPRCDFQIPGMN